MRQARREEVVREEKVGPDSPLQPGIIRRYGTRDLDSELGGLAGVGIFIFLTFRSLRERIDNLTLLAKEQKETLETVRTRATELDQLRKDYRQGLDDFQHLGEKIKLRRDALEKEYQIALQKKDEQIAQAKQLELKELELKEESLQLVPKLQQRLAETVEQLETQIKTLGILTPTQPANFDKRYRMIVSEAGAVLFQLGSLDATNMPRYPNLLDHSYRSILPDEIDLPFARSHEESDDQPPPGDTKAR